MFLRLDVVANRPVDLRAYWGNEPALVFLTGGAHRPSRMDHCRDWDYGWAGDPVTMRKWLTLAAPRAMDHRELRQTFAAVDGFKGGYFVSIINNETPEENWVCKI